MSTRSTLWYGDDLHLYREGFDDENVYLEIKTRYFDQLVVKIPLTAWKEMRQQTIQPAERYLDLTDEELRAEAEREVDEHRAFVASLKESPLRGLAGAFLFGPPESSREEMIDCFLRNFRPEIAGENSRARD